MQYKSCHLIEHGISIDVDTVKACCLSREFNKGQLMIEYKYEHGLIDWNHIFFVKRNHRTHQKNQRDLPACEGCYNLREDDWDDDDYISYINFDHWSQCNSDCIYCGVRKNKPKAKNNILKAIKELIKTGKFKNTGEITFQGGEPTLLKEFDSLLNLFLRQGCKIRIHSSGILFNRTIRQGIKNGAVTVVISPDSATEDVYKSIKRVDKSKQVWNTIRHYRKNLKPEFQNLVKVKYIIIPGVNDSLVEVDEFFNKIKKLDIKSLIVDIEYTYANKNINNISEHVYMLMDYIEHFATENGIEFDLYDSAKYAVQNRTFDKVTDFNKEKFGAKFNRIQWENLKQNISY